MGSGWNVKKGKPCKKCGYGKGYKSKHKIFGFDLGF